MEAHTKTSENPKEPVGQEYVLNRYRHFINYYWKASKSNKRSYKLTRTLTISLGAFVTLLSSIASADFIAENATWNTLVAILTPLLAAIMTIASGLTNSFHWGATWRDMTVNASNLEKNLDVFRATAPEKRDVKAELEKVNDTVIDETNRFFKRVLDSEVKPDEA